MDDHIAPKFASALHALVEKMTTIQKQQSECQALLESLIGSFAAPPVPAAPPKADRWLNTGQVAAEFKITDRQVRRLFDVVRDELAFKNGGIWEIRESDLPKLRRRASDMSDMSDVSRRR